MDLVGLHTSPTMTVAHVIFTKATRFHLIITRVYDMHLLVGAVYPFCNIIMGLTRAQQLMMNIY